MRKGAIVIMLVVMAALLVSEVSALGVGFSFGQSAAGTTLGPNFVATPTFARVTTTQTSATATVATAGIAASLNPGAASASASTAIAAALSV